MVPTMCSILSELADAVASCRSSWMHSLMHQMDGWQEYIFTESSCILSVTPHRKAAGSFWWLCMDAFILTSGRNIMHPEMLTELFRIAASHRGAHHGSMNAYCQLPLADAFVASLTFCSAVHHSMHSLLLCCCVSLLAPPWIMS